MALSLLGVANVPRCAGALGIDLDVEVARSDCEDIENLDEALQVKA